MAPCSYQCHTEEGRSHCSFSNSFGTRVSMGLATAPRTHVTNSVLHCTATSPETLKKWDEKKIRRCSLQEVLMNKRQCELQKVTETPRPSVRRVPSCVWGLLISRGPNRSNLRSMPDNIRYGVLNFIRRRTVWVEFGAVQGLLAVDWCF